MEELLLIMNQADSGSISEVRIPQSAARVTAMIFRACTGFDGGLEVGEAIRSGTLR